MRGCHFRMAVREHKFLQFQKKGGARGRSLEEEREAPGTLTAAK